jgi:N-acetylglucosaminyldiphosphoundecaprenol N-acetyl-beta-D-mannosaminyltransferase
MNKTINLFDLDFISAPNQTKILDQIINAKSFTNQEEKIPFLITPNADQIVKLAQVEHQALKKKLSKASFILPDGQPIIWFSKLIGKPLQARLAGSDLFPQVWQRAKEKQQKIFIVVSNESLGKKLKQDYENIEYYVPPMFDLHTASFNETYQEILNQIKEFKPKYLIIGVGFPKQEWLGLFIHKTLKQQNIQSPLILCLGASAEFYLGIKKRAPMFLQKLGLEWLHRLVTEPRRMWKRYILGSFSLLTLFTKEWKKQISQKTTTNGELTHE